MSTPALLFLADRFKKDKGDIRIVRSYGDVKAVEGLLFKGLPNDWKLSGFVFTDKISDADFVLLPQAVRRVTPAWQVYFDRVYSEARAHNKEVILFIGTDLSHRTHIERPHLAVFKSSDYRSAMIANEAIMPGYAEDLGQQFASTPRKKSAKAVVSFCGYAGFPNTKTHVRFLIKNALIDLQTLVTRDAQSQVYKRGIYFRRRALSILEASDRVSTNFVIRTSFSGNAATATKDPAQLRQEYVDNMVDSDFVLSPKGDGNYSIRFYEALSLGRIPLVIDTDMRLPLESTIDYSKFTLRVPHTAMDRLGDIVADYYEKLSDEEFIAMQDGAREAFKTHLRYDKYFNTALPLLKERGIAALQ